MRTHGLPVPHQGLPAFLESGVSLAVATRDDRMVVEIVRCAAARIDEAGLVHVAIPVPEGQRALVNIDSTGVIALTAALPTDYSTMQLKGSDARRIAWPGVEHAVAAHRARFLQNLTAVGLPDAYALSLWSNDCVCIAFTPSEMFDQTPGPAAGLPLVP